MTGRHLLASSLPFYGSALFKDLTSFSPLSAPCLQVSDKGGGVPFRRIENLFSYMYSTAPAPQMGEHTRPPLVSRDTGGGLPGIAFINSISLLHVLKNKYRFFCRRKDAVNCTICHAVAFLYSLQASKCSFSLLFRLSFLLKD